MGLWWVSLHSHPKQKKQCHKRAPLLCAVLNLSVLCKGCVQCPGKQQCDGIVKYFVTAPSLHTQNTQWLTRTGMWHVQLVWETGRAQVKLTSSQSQRSYGEKRSQQGERWKKKLWAPLSSGFVTLSSLNQILRQDGPHGMDIECKESQGPGTSCPPSLDPLSSWVGQKVTLNDVWTHPFLWANMLVAFRLMNCAF